MTMKLIAVQEGLHQAATMLRDEGYLITNIDESIMPIDAIVYSTQNVDYVAHNTSGTMGIPANNKFVKMINIDEVGLDNLISSIEEID